MLRDAAVLRRVALMALASVAKSDRHVQHSAGLRVTLLTAHLKHCVGLFKPKHAW